MKQQDNITFQQILKLLTISDNEQRKILIDLNEALGLSIYSHYKDKFCDNDKIEFKQLMEGNDSDKLISFLLARTNKEELQKIVQEESEKIIKDFMQGYLKLVSAKEKEKIFKKLEDFL